MTLAQTDILKKASKLFNNYGTRSVTMSDIANELGISKKTLYQYITDKEALIDMVLESEYSHMEEALQVTKQISHPIKQFIEIQNAIISNLLNQSGVIGFGLKKYYPDKYKYYFDKYVSLVKEIIDQVNTDSLVSFVRILSGEDSLLLDDQLPPSYLLQIQ